jgi:hypothetical protein
LDGNRIAVGAKFDDGNGERNPLNYGAVYLYSFANSSFNSPTLQSIIGYGYTGGKNISLSLEARASTLSTKGDIYNYIDRTGDYFGSSVSLDGNRLAVGAVRDDGQNNASSKSGAVYLFTFADSTFTSGSHVGTIGSGYNTQSKATIRP